MSTKCPKSPSGHHEFRKEKCVWCGAGIRTTREMKLRTPSMKIDFEKTRGKGAYEMITVAQRGTRTLLAADWKSEADKKFAREFLDDIVDILQYIKTKIQKGETP